MKIVSDEYCCNCGCGRKLSIEVPMDVADVIVEIGGENVKLSPGRLHELAAELVEIAEFKEEM